MNPTLLRTLRHAAFLVITLVLFAAIPPLLRLADPTSAAPYDWGFLQRPFVALFSFAVMLAGVWAVIHLGFSTFRAWLAKQGQEYGGTTGFAEGWNQLQPWQRTLTFLGVFLILAVLYVVILAGTPV